MGAIQDIKTMGDSYYGDKDDKYNEIVRGLKNGDFKIIFITGSGISTNAGIPSFRSKGGLFDLAKEEYHLNRPESILQINYFYKNPYPFYKFYKKVYITKHTPTKTHLFMGFLCKKNFVKRIFTQNVDGLEISAGVPEDKITFAHGTINEASCPGCLKKYSIKDINEYIKKEEFDKCRCSECGKPVKPKIVFYGENLPDSFFKTFNDIYDANLAFIMGTSLAVYPFNQLPYGIKEGWRVLINNKEVENFFSGLITMNQFRFNNPKKKDLFLNVKTDNFVEKLVKDCGWKEEFDNYCKEKLMEQPNEEKKVENNDNKIEEEKVKEMNIINEN